MPDNVGKKKDTRFKKGQSGNPAGMPKGTRHKVTRAVDALLDGEAEEITRKAIEMAKQGDGTAIRLCLDRICPPRRDRHIRFDLPPISSAKDAATAQAAIVAGVAAGDLTPGEAADLAKVVAGYTQAVQAAEHDERLLKLEKMIENLGVKS